MNDERTASRAKDLPAPSGWASLDEVDREEFLRVDPGASRLWRLAPPHLRRDYTDGHVDSTSFWNQLRRWLVFEGRAA